MERFILMAGLPPEPKQRKLNERYGDVRFFTIILYIIFFDKSSMRYVSNRCATEPAEDVLLLNGFIRFNRNAYNESSNPEVSRVTYSMLICSWCVRELCL